MVPQITINDRTNWNQSFFANLWGVFFGLHKNDSSTKKLFFSHRFRGTNLDL